MIPALVMGKATSKASKKLRSNMKDKLKEKVIKDFKLEDRVMTEMIKEESGDGENVGKYVDHNHEAMISMMHAHSIHLHLSSCLLPYHVYVLSVQNPPLPWPTPAGQTI